MVAKTQRQRSEYRGYGFGPNAPSRKIPFPAHANMTAVELLSFLPNSTHSPDVVYRLVTNGATFHLLRVIVNTQRHLLIEWSHNCCRQSVYDTMNRGGYKGWRIGNHNTFGKNRMPTWDPANLEVAGLLPPGRSRNKEGSANEIPFKDLAVDVQCMPEGDDALDLTRMVLYCVKNPEEPWLYPRDWSALLNSLGGPAAIRREHTDREAFRRWGDILPPHARNAPPDPWWPATQEKQGIKRTADGWGEGNPAISTQKRGTILGLNSLIGKSLIPETQQQKRPRGRPRKSTRIDEETTVGSQDECIAEANAVAQPTVYVAPPKNATKDFETALDPDKAIKRAFLRESQARKVDPYSAYAFGGPRHAPPFRQLHRIEQPDPEDNSGWAENLRWAFEQVTLFRYPHRPDAWNESPEHMERIVEIRREQCWMSEELEKLMKEESFRQIEDEELLKQMGEEDSAEEMKEDKSDQQLVEEYEKEIREMNDWLKRAAQ
ncbi:hypothetical protein DDE83_004383 [Stemphylium lycopersici]|uniref:Uncharacterized protein n=1 Tax=Stemphylium lycopersici TaxID=183478 RepID=A0A364N4S0_STELY|nr:hypothetical protein DDE83_004383 [Stemphylium lycopersici]